MCPLKGVELEFADFSANGRIYKTSCRVYLIHFLWCLVIVSNVYLFGHVPVKR